MSEAGTTTRPTSSGVSGSPRARIRPPPGGSGGGGAGRPAAVEEPSPAPLDSKKIRRG
ncbi:hypothetical protein APASM_6013 [Actinosynnema pretiosum subsp. pretiosum]|nr:hypothetical protein APASM_6013 [Actinosynnema pretiosum subsp. pretiosum]